MDHPVTDEEYAAAQRAQENALFNAWEQGYRASMHDYAEVASGGAIARSRNPYQFHAKDANQPITVKDIKK